MQSSLISSKMSKTINKKQIEQLINLMQMHPEIARGGYSKGNKEEFNRFWHKAEEELNSLGPPSKNVSEWKKVWTDQKKYVKYKAELNLKVSKRTAEPRFSATEQAIYHLIGMNESVEGVSDSDNNVTMQEAGNPFENMVEVLIEDDEFDEVTPYQTPAKKYQKSKLLTPTVSSDDVHIEELDIQKEIYEIMKDQHQSINEIYRSIDRLYDLQKQHFQQIEKAKNDELEELKRHNLVMEKLRLKEVESKIEKNRRSVEVKDFVF